MNLNQEDVGTYSQLIPSVPVSFIVATLSLVVAGSFGLRFLISRTRSRETRTHRNPIFAAIVIIVVVATVLVFASGWNEFIPDTKLLYFWNPERGFAQSFSMWNSTRDLGTYNATSAPLVFLFNSLISFLDPWIVQRLFHLTLICTGAIGTAFVVRRFFPSERIAPTIAGLWFVIAPYTVAFMRPSGLYIYIAICPWLVLATYNGICGNKYLRWSAIFALLVAIPGTLNLPSLVWTCLPLLPLIGYCVWIGKASFRSIGRFVLSSSILLALIFLPALYRLFALRGSLVENLSATETIATISQSSSWTESLRGLGGWLVYWNIGQRGSNASVSEFLTNPLLLLLSFVPVIIAFVVVALNQRRARLLFGAILIVASGAMVGVFPYSEPPLVGWVLRKFYELGPAFFSLRSTFKAGGGLLLATSVLFGVGIAIAYKWIESRRRSRSIAKPIFGAVVVLGMFACAFPFWSGAIYNRSGGISELPDYWKQAVSWLDDQNGSERVLIAPGADSAIYRWGDANSGDIFSSLMERPFVQKEPLQSGPPDALNLTNALIDLIDSGAYQHGELGPIAKRLGIGWVLIRNDLDWEKSGSIPPEWLESLRTDPDLKLAATFGGDGQNTSGEQLSDGDVVTRSLRPVEIYKVEGSIPMQRAIASRPSLLVSGDGGAWPRLALSGILNGGNPIEYTGRLDSESVGTAVAAGSPIIITDTNRRLRTSFSVTTTPTLSVESKTKASDLFGDPATQTVADFTDASVISESGPTRLFAPNAVNRPAVAFDRDLNTSWIAGLGSRAANQSIDVVLKEPKRISSVRVLSTRASDGYREVAKAELITSAGVFPIPIQLNDGVGFVEFEPQVVDSFSIVIKKLKDSGGQGFGFSEITIEGLDLTEYLRLPVDIQQDATSDPQIFRSLSTAPMQISMQRINGIRDQDEEASLRRIFELIADRIFSGTGTFRVGNGLSDEGIASLVNSPVKAVGTSRFDNEIAASGMLAVDGNTATGWSAGERDPRLTVTFPQRIVDRVELMVDESENVDTPSVIRIESGGRSTEFNLVRDSACVGIDLPCLRRVAIPIPRQRIDRISIDVPSQQNLGLPPARIVEVMINGATNEPLPVALSGTCRSDILSLDGSPIAVRFLGATSELFEPGDIRVESCSPLQLSSGEHRLESLPPLALQSFSLTTVGFPRFDRSIETGPEVDTTFEASTVFDLEISPTSGDLIIFGGQGFYEGWRASSEGKSIGQPIERDTQISWQLQSSASSTNVRIEYGPDTLYRTMLWISFVGLLLSLSIAITGPQLRKRQADGHGLEIGPTGVAFLYVLSIAGGIAVAGISGLLFAAVCALLHQRRLITGKIVALGATALVVVAVLASLPPLGPSLGSVTPFFSIERDLANSASRLAAVALITALSLFVIEYAKESVRDK